MFILGAKVKNGKIELMRFVFCIIVMLFHISERTIGESYEIFSKVTFFGNGYFGVEFFFVLSGCLMAASAYKKQSQVSPLGKDTFGFMKGKLLAILPWHIIVFIIAFVYTAVSKFDTLNNLFVRVLNVIPNFLLIQRSGLYGKDVLGVEWYISDMLIAMIILYPLCRRYYERFTRIAAPVTAVLVVGYLMKTTGSINGSTAWSVIVSKTLLRAIAELCAGAFVFEVSRNIKKLNFTRLDKVLLTAFEFVSYAAVIGFTTLNISDKYAGTFIIFVCTGICLSFSGITYGSKFFNNRMFVFLGSLSLPLYLCHSVTRRIVAPMYGEYSFLFVTVVFMVSSFAMVFILMPLEKVLRRAINNKIQKLITH